MARLKRTALVPQPSFELPAVHEPQDTTQLLSKSTDLLCLCRAIVTKTPFREDQQGGRPCLRAEPRLLFYAEQPEDCEVIA